MCFPCRDFIKLGEETENFRASLFPERLISVKTLFIILFYFLAYTSWLWPCVFVHFLLKAQKKLMEGEGYSKEAIFASLALVFICISPFVIVLLVS